MEKESGENDNFDSIVKALEEREKESKNGNHKRFVECEICHKKIKNKPDTIRSHKKYHEKKQDEKKPVQAKPIIEKEQIKIKPVIEKPPTKNTKDSLISDVKGFKFNAADMILIGGLVFVGLLFISVIRPGRPAGNTTAPIETAEPIQQTTAPIAPPYPYYR
jgi:hypothetical protein